MKSNDFGHFCNIVCSKEASLLSFVKFVALVLLRCRKKKQKKNRQNLKKKKLDPDVSIVSRNNKNEVSAKKK